MKISNLCVLMIGLVIFFEVLAFESAWAEEALPAKIEVQTTSSVQGEQPQPTAEPSSAQPAQISQPQVETKSDSPVLKDSSVPTLRAPGKIIVGIVSAESRAEFDSSIVPFFKSQWSGCSSCELRNLSVYDEKGNLDQRGLINQFEASLAGVNFLLFNVNWRYKAEDHKVLVDLLKKATANNLIVVGSAGYPKEGESSAPLSRTLLSQVPDLVIIGEINERERLLGSSYFGPEMLTAIKPPKDYVGKGLGPSFFAAKLALNYTRKLPHDWIAHFRTQKMKSRKIWPQVEEFFQR